ncbi:hypothetical protein [Arthrobacter antibioticus]|uniref:hypothetical protein n=1 Tax=Arthrobacter sp. H35-MC1 TaxID=3046203 RepID=UPI0024BA41EE|nr:hypothetical protein [Arthrobacter sp. H35-MC1]MDJ0318874.1 hypothetical protein [Arthrobacter sp. H35-MC1]
MVSRKAEGTARRGFPRWAIVTLIVVVVLAIVVGVSIWYQKNPSATVAAPSPSASIAPVGGDIPNGCLAGKDTSVTALIGAQKKAPHTEAGAVGLAAAFMRWGWQYPYPSLSDGQIVVESLASTDAGPSFKDLSAKITAAKPKDGWASGGLSFAEGRYLVEDSTQDRVKVTVGGDQIKNGLRVPNTKSLTTVTLVWESEAWKVQEIKPVRTLEDLFTNGAALAGGC